MRPLVHVSLGELEIDHEHGPMVPVSTKVVDGDGEWEFGKGLPVLQEGGPAVFLSPGYDSLDIGSDLFQLSIFRTKPQRKVAEQVEPVALNPSMVHKPSLCWRVRQFVKNLLDGSFFIPVAARIARRCGLLVMYSSLYGRVIHGDGSVTNLGLLGRRLVTTAGVAYLAADVGGGASDMNLMKFHAFGTGTVAESTGDTGPGTEFTTEYASDNVRPTGSQANSTNTFTTVGTFSPDAGGTLAVTEHVLMSSATVGAGTAWDRTKFTAVNLVAGSDSLQATYVGTFPSGG